MYQTIATVIACVLALAGVLCFAGAMFSREDIDEACGRCCKCGTAEAPVKVQGKLYCIACIRKNRKSMGEYKTMPWYGGCQK